MLIGDWKPKGKYKFLEGKDMISVRIIREQIGASLREADGEVVTGNVSCCGGGCRMFRKVWYVE